jgi:hypothetical protein
LHAAQRLGARNGGAGSAVRSTPSSGRSLTRAVVPAELIGRPVSSGRLSSSIDRSALPGDVRLGCSRPVTRLSRWALRSGSPRREPRPRRRRRPDSSVKHPVEDVRRRSGAWVSRRRARAAGTATGLPVPVGRQRHPGRGGFVTGLQFSMASMPSRRRIEPDRGPMPVEWIMTGDHEAAGPAEDQAMVRLSGSAAGWTIGHRGWRGDSAPRAGAGGRAPPRVSPRHAAANMYRSGRGPVAPASDRTPLIRALAQIIQSQSNREASVDV